MDAHVHPRPQLPKAAGLSNILNEDPSSTNGPPPQLRDSGFYSTTDTASKHTSATSFSVSSLSPAASAYQSSADKTPSPVAGNMIPQAIVSPAVGHMSVASIMAPNTPGISEHRRLEHSASMESTQTGTTLGENLMPGTMSRRESVDSRINQGLSDMRLGNSPYASQNHSTTSIQNSLHQQRNPRSGLDTPSIHRISNGYQPSAERMPESKTVRTAPAITGPATGTIARAAEPTKGQAWAFPEEEVGRGNQSGVYDTSRRSSFSESVASSQFTADSRLPPGQRRLEDGPSPPSLNDYSVHHHSLQHRQLSDLQAQDGSTGAQPYSRTPELRVSHKLAERKRRTEMKELFDALRDEMPQERGSKASKWEILTKAINEHRAQKECIKTLQARCHSVMSENEMLRRELQSMRVGGGQYRPDTAQPQQMPPAAAPAQPSAQPPYVGEHFAGANRTELPPLRSISNGVPNGPDSMTGVQYEAPTGVNGYRPERY
ncbi:unnamed protein product [Clonostachys rosea]|uniref:BHLH domain-containing protein n=1 Tax=Bionectria ochroleuca TaxID=29856 RepID=A0ABY6TWH7_BIOOC|nr:unnamed protein product [Clonostachys rosea]